MGFATPLMNFHDEAYLEQIEKSNIEFSYVSFVVGDRCIGLLCLVHGL